MALGIGDRLPSFSLEDQNGDLRTPASVQGRWLVLFFYPKDDTPGCTAEACSFRDNAESFAALDAEVWGISGDDAVSHRRFATRHNLTFLQTLGLRTLVRLENEEYPPDLKDWIDASGIRVVDCILTANKEPFQTTDPATLAMALGSVLDAKQHPVLVHSLRGQRRTGVLIGCYRKLRSWSLAAIFEECVPQPL